MSWRFRLRHLLDILLRIPPVFVMDTILAKRFIGWNLFSDISGPGYSGNFTVAYVLALSARIFCKHLVCMNYEIVPCCQQVTSL